MILVKSTCRTVFCAGLALTIGCLTAAHAAAPTAAILELGSSDEKGVLADALMQALSDAGYVVSKLDAGAWADSDAAQPASYDLLVLPNGAAAPATLVPILTSHLRNGGNLIALHTPILREVLVRAGDRWITRAQYAQQRAATPPEHILFDHVPDSVSQWERSSNAISSPTLIESVESGLTTAGHALHVVTPQLSGWDTFSAALPSAGFPADDTLTVISARGDETTTTLLVEWREKDNSRWIATVPLTPTWKQYVLAPGDFKYWSDSNPARGFAGDCFQPANASIFSFGVAFSHGCAPGARHEYWLGAIGAAAMTPEYEQLATAVNLPALDTLCPQYKLFDSDAVEQLCVREDQALVPDAKLPTPSEVRSPHPRPAGGGFDKGRDWRWIPLIEARTADGDWRGTPATLTVNAGGEYRGGVWASFGIDDAAWYQSPATVRLIRDLAARMRQPAFILDGGSNFYTYFEDQTMMLGVRAVNVTSEPVSQLTARVTLLDADNGEQVALRTWPLQLGPHEVARVADDFSPPAWPDAGFRVIAELLDGVQVIDRVEHEAHVWRPKKTKQFVTVKDGEFILAGRRWRPHGINYMPSSGIGIEDRAYFEYWIGARSYGPEVIQRDLERVKKLGFNSVSIFTYRRSIEAHNLLDLLRRLDALGMKANLSLRTIYPDKKVESTPMNFLWRQTREIIEHYRLWENDAVFAYDIAWEPAFGSRGPRDQWDPQWKQWIVERYGDIATAEQDWEFSTPRKADGTLTNPTPEQITADGPWRRMVAAYRRFLDTLLYKKFSAARRLIRGVDPNHLVSFRMWEGGNPTFRYGNRIPYDFPYLAAAVDILEPEAYGRIGDWERVKPGWFEREYARWAAPEKPMIWAEAGVSTWDGARGRNDPARLDFQADYYRDLYRMFIASSADGVFFWWWPGGFRVNENSDYGVINPDGSDRPVTRVIREYAPKFLEGPALRPVDHWITIDRDRHPDGVAGIYDDVKDEFWKAIASGQVPGLCTAGAGTDSSSCPLIGVGNTPLSGHNPPKYLDAAFDGVQVLDAEGAWVSIAKGGSVRVRSDQPVEARLSLTNLGEAAWQGQKPSDDATVMGAVYVAVCGDDTRLIPLPRRVAHLSSIELPSVLLAPAGLSKTLMVTLTLEADGRTRFGEKYRITLAP